MKHGGKTIFSSWNIFRLEVLNDSYAYCMRTDSPPVSFEYFVNGKITLTLFNKLLTRIIKKKNCKFKHSFLYKVDQFSSKIFPPVLYTHENGNKKKGTR